MEKSRELMQKMIKICVEKIYPYLAIEFSNLMNRIISLSIENIPKIEAILMEGIEIMFAPRQLIKQVHSFRSPCRWIMSSCAKI
jgi:hypothetical protein